MAGLVNLLLVFTLLVSIVCGTDTLNLVVRLNNLSKGARSLIGKYEALHSSEYQRVGGRNLAYPSRVGLPASLGGIQTQPGEPLSSGNVDSHFPCQDNLGSMYTSGNTGASEVRCNYIIPKSIPSVLYNFRGVDLTIIQRYYRSLIGEAKSASELLKITLPQGFPGYEFKPSPGHLLENKFEDFVDDAIRKFNNAVSDASSDRPVSTRRNEGTDLGVKKFASKVWNGNGLPNLICEANGSYKMSSWFVRYLNQRRAIVMIHCENESPTTTYYTLVYYPGDDRYTITNFLAHLVRVYDHASFMQLHPLQDVSQAIQEFQGSLKSTNADICGAGRASQPTVVWSTAE